MKNGLIGTENRAEMLGFSSGIPSHPLQSTAPFRDLTTHQGSEIFLSITQFVVDLHSRQGFSAFLPFRAFLARQEWLGADFQEGAMLEQLNAARLIQYIQSSDQTLPFHIAWATGISSLLELRITQTFIQCTQRTDIFYDNGSFPFSFSIFFLQFKFQRISSIFHISESHCSFTVSNPISPDVRGSKILKSSWIIILLGALIQIENFVQCWLLPFYLLLFQL